MIGRSRSPNELISLGRIVLFLAGTFFNDGEGPTMRPNLPPDCESGRGRSIEEEVLH
jgi:hypothetical protein